MARNSLSQQPHGHGKGVHLDIKNYDGGMTDSDEVDRLIAAWRRERPDLDVAPMAVLSRISRLAVHLDRARRAAFAQYDLDTWEFDVLSALRRSGAPYELSPGRLVTETMVTSGTMTNRVDRLHRRGLVDRLADSNDRRGVIVRLTAAGLAAVDGALDALLTFEDQTLSTLNPVETEALVTALRTLSMGFETN